MIPKDKVYIKKGERGIPYTLREARLVAETQGIDEYHRGIMCWLIYEVERLKKEVKDTEGDLATAIHEINATVRPVVRTDPIWVCATCGHEWDDGDRPHCIACGTPYRKPNNHG